MAAAEYFSSAPMQHAAQSPYQHTPTSHSRPSISSPSYNYSQPQINTQPPPPYAEQSYSEQTQRPGVHFAPTPVELQQRHSFSGQSRPPQQAWSQPQQSYNNQYPQHNMALAPTSQPYGTPPSSNGYGTSPQKPQYLTPHMRPYANPNSSQYSLEHGGYNSDPEPHGHRHKHRRRRDSGESRSASTKSSSRSKNADAFVGAAGAGLIGDMILPGLGTVGGAALGWLGGKNYGSHRKEREGQRHKDQEKWEAKYRSHDRSRSRGSSRGSSTPLGEYDERDHHRRRNSHY